jgi:hypothetical protein
MRFHFSRKSDDGCLIPPPDAHFLEIATVLADQLSQTALGRRVSRDLLIGEASIQCLVERQNSPQSSGEVNVCHANFSENLRTTMPQDGCVNGISQVFKTLVVGNKEQEQGPFYPGE